MIIKINICRKAGIKLYKENVIFFYFNNKAGIFIIYIIHQIKTILRKTIMLWTKKEKTYIFNEKLDFPYQHISFLFWWKYIFMRNLVVLRKKLLWL